MSSEAMPRNPGPSWGYQFLRFTDRVLPEWAYRPLRAVGTFIALLGMPAQRRYSREYLALVLPRRPTWRDVFRHFFAFEEVLMARLRFADGKPFGNDYGPGADDFRQWLEHGGPVLLGTFHIGVSDLQGCQIAAQPEREIYVVRQRVANSHDTDRLAERLAGRLHFVWVNDPAEALFHLKEAAETPAAIALQCDRLEFAARAEPFEFLGARRLFPVTIYELAMIFRRPVLLSVGIPQNAQFALLHASPRFDPDQPGESRDAARQRAHRHFQGFLRQVESLLREHPYQWFNFTPMNPSAASVSQTP